MCGICGYAGTRQVLTSQALESMTAAIKHRGPDATGMVTFEDGPGFCGLGHTRLSIIDLAGGAQPMCNEDGTIWIVFNGEIYNHRDLRSSLESLGHRYTTSSDTETILHLYEQYGRDCVHHLLGMFAFAIWDDARKTLFAARDRLGIKPFYYGYENDALIFGSEIKAIVQSGKIHPALNRKKLNEYLAFGYLTDEATLFSGIHKLLPGHWLTWEKGAISTGRYWDVNFEAKDVRPRQAIEQELGRLFENAVQMRLMSDVPLGMFLSGGLDSSAIAATMAKLNPDRINAFTVDFGQGYYSESSYAEIVADASNMQLHKVTVTSRMVVDALEKLIWHNDLPIHFPASIPLYFVSLEASRHVKVVLTGEGSDELFGGYGRYRRSVLNMRMATMLKGMVPDAVRQVIQKHVWHLPVPMKLKKALAHSLFYHQPDVSHLILDNYYGIFTQKEIQALTGGTAGNDMTGVYDNYLNYFHRFPDEQVLNRMLYADMKTYLEELLMKQDKMSMATSVESRVPFLDHRLVEMAAILPENLKIKGRHLKYIFKQVSQKLLPPDIIHRPKMGFPLPLETWMKEPFFNGFVKDILLDSRTRDRGLFSRKQIKTLMDDHEKNRRDNSLKIWQLLNFELWSRTFLDRP
ncbi:MAG: asparagine synthase (glutamine-hydrolyzing) [Desulfotignum sp.]|nr:asparagine synthase (glutamine-hydrolyzing) [Desulfotignum sp.]MCF8135802.1 asparagine synthase (glutamine-hydrolyzing) [Desulfotignum sp.]